MIPLLTADAPSLPTDVARIVHHLEQRVRAEPKPAELLALAEVWSRIAEARELEAQEAWIAASDRCLDTPGCDVGAVVPDLSLANMARERAAVRYRQVIRDLPDDPGVDLAVYGLGHAWLGLGRDDLADAAFTWLGAARPDSPLAQRAWLHVGERAFDRWDSPWALVAYGGAHNGDPELALWADYKAAWSRYRLGEYAGAIDGMKRVIQASDTLDDEALKDLARFFADAGELDEAMCNWGPRNRERDRAMLDRLADIYVEQGKWDSAILIWRRLAAEAPHERAVWYARVLDVYLQQNRVDDALSELDRILKLPEAEQAAAGHGLEHGVREVAFELHRRGHTAGDSERVSTALRLYEVHRSRWPDAEHAEEITWGYAVALEDLGDPRARSVYRTLAPTGRYGDVAGAAIARLERAGR
jgi:tetratricopeptide (TPR) repeat protein